MRYEIKEPFNHPDNLEEFDRWEKEVVWKTREGSPERANEVLLAFIWEYSPFGKYLMESQP